MPLLNTVTTKLEDDDLDYFYWFAHSPGGEFPDSTRFLLDWNGEDSWYKATDVNDALSDRDAVKFAFIGSCEGITNIGSGTLSYAFRKGQTTNTVTVGYTHMSSSQGWADLMPW